MNRADSKSHVRQCLGFCTADFWSSLANESAEQKTKHCLTFFRLPASSGDETHQDVDVLLPRLCLHEPRRHHGRRAKGAAEPRGGHEAPEVELGLLPLAGPVAGPVGRAEAAEEERIDLIGWALLFRSFQVQSIPLIVPAVAASKPELQSSELFNRM